MRAPRHLVALLFLVLVTTHGAPRQALANPAVLATVDPAEATVGDRVRVRLTVTGAGLADRPLLPRMEAWGAAEVLEQALFEPGELEGPAASWQAGVVLTAFRPGLVELPPLPLALARDAGVTLQTPEGLSFTVLSVLPPGGAQPMPPARPRPLPATNLLAWLILLAGLAALALAITILLWRRRRAPRASRPGLAPLPALLAELERLEGSSLSVEALHTALSLALRRFLRDALHVPALERTTTEIQRSLATTPLAPSSIRSVVELLRQCDTVKFARQRLPLQEASARLAAARALGREIDDTLEAALRPSEAAA